MLDLRVRYNYNRSLAKKHIIKGRCNWIKQIAIFIKTN